MKLIQLGFVLLGWLVAWVAPAQPTTTVLTGRVMDAATGQPLPFAHVFINTTTRGTTSDEAGRYQLTGVPLGTIEVVASYVGYQPYRQTLRLVTNQPRPVDLRLKATSRTLAGVTVTADHTRSWERNYRKFKNELLGDSPFASQCAIINGKRIRFTEENGHLKASADEPLLIENKALGYRIRYDLLSFDTYRGVTYYGGTTQFEELKPETDRQADRWQRNRQRAYLGSTRHLLASLIAGTYERDGFLVYQSNLNVPVGNSTIPILAGSAFGSPRPVRADSLFRPGELPFERWLVSRLPLEVFYTKLYRYSSPYRDMPYAYSLITLPRGPAGVTTDGWVQRPDGMEVRGYLGNDRLANLLPADWRPADPAAADSPPLAAVPTPTTGQVLPPDRLLDSLRLGWQQRSRQRPPAVFVHVDKPLYLTGDRLYLSAYVLNPTTGQPIEQRLTAGEDQTPALHLELLSPAGRPVLHQWLRITNGRATNDFRLSDTLQSGTYRLRAYTDPVHSAFGPSFERLVPVYGRAGDAGPATGRSDHPAPDRLDVQLLPEGGRWVAGLEARFGIKVVGADGHGRPVAGRIVDARGHAAERFVTNAFGMGRAELTPEPGQTYRVELDSAAGRADVRLPPAEPEGLVLRADLTDDQRQLLVRVRGTGRSALEPVYLTLQNRGRVMRQAKLRLQDGGVQIALLTAKLPPGLAQLTLYDAGGRPRAERLVFVPDREPPARVELTPGKPVYQAREQVVLGLRLTDGTPDPLAGMLSASVTDADQLPADTLAADFRAHWLLTGDPRGLVEAPGFYFRDTLASTRRALDDLLLTQGWRRLSGQPPADAAVVPADTLGGIALSGQVLDSKGNPLPRVNLLLTSLNTNVPISRLARTDDAGRFRVGGLLLADTVRFQVRVMDDAHKPVDASVRTDALGGRFERYVPDSTAPPDWTHWRSILAAARARQEGDPDRYREKDARQLNEVIVKAYKPREGRPDDVRRMSLPGEADATIVFDENGQRYTNAYEMLRGRVAGVSVTPKLNAQREPTGGYTVVIRGVSSFGAGANSPLYLWDGNYLQEDQDGTALLMINPNEIERVEVLKNGGSAIYGARGGTGVIAFYSRKWRPDKPSKAAQGVSELTVYGFSTTREFYVPRYTASPDGAAPVAIAAVDRRDVLYWKPLLQTDAQGQAVIVFSLSDVARTVRVTVQGVTSEGQPVSSVQVLKVR